MAKSKLTSRKENYSEWYNQLVVRADLAEQSAVRGCMVIKPYGYAISGTYAVGFGRYVQVDWSKERLFSSIDSEIVSMS